MPDWRGSGEIFTGGGTQVFMPSETSKLSMTSDANSLYPVVQKPSSAVSGTADGSNVSSHDQKFDPRESTTSVDISPDLTLPSPAENDCGGSATTSTDISLDLSQLATASPSTTIAQTPDNSFDDGSNS